MSHSALQKSTVRWFKLAAAEFWYEEVRVTESIIQSCVALRRGYVLRNAPLGDFVVT